VKFAAVPSALTPNKVLAAHKVMIPPDNKANNLKVIYTVPQNQAQLVVLPKSTVESMNRLVIPQPQLRKLLPKLDTTPQNVENTGAAVKKIAPMGGKDIQNDSCDQEEDKYIGVGESKFETKAEEAEAVLDTVPSESTVDKVSVNMDNTDSTSHTSFTAKKSTHILDLCSNCRKELILFSKGLSSSKFPKFCAICAKKHAFLKRNGKLLLFPRNKIFNSEKSNIKMNNGRLVSTSNIKARHKIVSAKKNSDLKRSSNSIALNGPTNVKKLKTSDFSVENNKYRCHICKVLISMDWFKIQEHFASNHPNFKLLVLSPKVSKLKMNQAHVRVPFVTKDHIRPKVMCMKKGATQSNAADINEVNENGVNDDDNEDYQFQENCDSKESNNTDNEKTDNSHENGGYFENAYYLKKERDIPIDYDLVPSKIKRKKKSSQKASDKTDKEVGANTPFTSGQTVPALQQVLSSGHKYECSKCHYADSCAESFHEHIKLHRSDESAFQCMECGMCFVAKPSLKKHLFLSHHIKNAEAYLQDNNCFINSAKGEEIDDTSKYKESSPPLEDFSPDLVENQCRVCRKIFDSAFQLSKHFRTHGMAFLLMKKHGNKGQ
jgi:hypothetical protein